MKNRSGISLLSMIIYVVLFFGFMAFATAISANMNYTSLSNKGMAMNSEQFEKLQSNMIDSAKNSESIDNINGKIVFSNGDEYEYNSEKKYILKNGGILVSNVTNFEIGDINLVKGYFKDTQFNSESSDYIQLDNLKNYVCLNVTFEKYGSTDKFQIFTVAGDEIDE